MPLAASVLLHVVPTQPSIITSSVIAIVITQPLVSLVKVRAVPIGYATLALAGIVYVLALVSTLG